MKRMHFLMDTGAHSKLSGLADVSMIAKTNLITSNCNVMIVH